MSQQNRPSCSHLWPNRLRDWPVSNPAGGQLRTWTMHDWYCERSERRSTLAFCAISSTLSHDLAENLGPAGPSWVAFFWQKATYHNREVGGRGGGGRALQVVMPGDCPVSLSLDRIQRLVHFCTNSIKRFLVRLFIFLSVSLRRLTGCVCVCVSRRHVHISACIASDLTYNLIPTPERFSHAF